MNDVVLMQETEGHVAASRGEGLQEEPDGNI